MRVADRPVEWAAPSAAQAVLADPVPAIGDADCLGQASRVSVLSRHLSQGFSTTRVLKEIPWGAGAPAQKQAALLELGRWSHCGAGLSRG